MGVPKFCSWLKHNQKIYNIYFNYQIQPKEKYDYLFFDANSIIYEFYNKLENKEDLKLEDILINNTINYLDENINKIKAKVSYIAFDGTPPFAKITQQRIRRFTSYYQNKLINENNNWPANCHISPGTLFMQKLDKSINEYIKKSKNKIIYSSYNNIGEGEHKIMQYIKKYCKNNKIMIYGGDTDMIFLSLIQTLENNNYIYIYNHINNIDNYYDINKIKNLLIKILKSYSSILSEINIYDFIIICFVIGNDFLHNIPFYDIYNIDELINCYVHALEKFNDNLLCYKEDNLIKIDMYNLLQFIKELKNRELIMFKQDEKLMSPNYTIELLKKNNNNKICTFDKVEKLRLKQKDYNNFNFINLNDKSDYDITDAMITYKYNYYNYYLKTNNLKIINNMCLSYYYGILWNVYYYFNCNLINDLSADCPNWEWCYKYYCSPFITDLLNLLEKKYNEINFIPLKNKPLTLKQQLFYIIPEKYLKDINKELYNIVQNHKYLNPENVKFDTIHKINLYECSALIPLYNCDVIKNIIK